MPLATWWRWPQLVILYGGRQSQQLLLHRRHGGGGAGEHAPRRGGLGAAVTRQSGVSSLAGGKAPRNI
eukprot:6194196-Pleurochrysis_carterae.AAC.6